MNIFSRARNKLANLIATKDSKTFGILVQRSGVVYSDRNYENFAKESYMKNVIVFRAVDVLAKAVSSIPWDLFRKKIDGGREEVENDSFNEVLKRPNFFDSWNFLIIKASAYLQIAGNSYFEKVSPITGTNQEMVREMYVLRPDRVTIDVDENSGLIRKYIYTVNGKLVDFDVIIKNGKMMCDILHLKQFHPLDDWYGLATTEPVAREIDSSNEATDFNKNFLENRAVPGMVFIHKENLTEAQWNRLERQLKENYSGSENAGKNLILEGLDDVKPYGFSPAEMDFIESNRELARRISYAYGVPPQLIGIPGDNTYSNYQEARLAFYEDTVIPLLNFIISEFNNWLFGNSELFLDIMLDDVPALALKREKLWERAQSSDFITINEKREMVGFEAVEGGDVVLVPANLLPLSAQPTQEELEEVEEELTEENRANQNCKL